MAERDEFDNQSGVRDVIRKLLFVALPADLRAAAPDLVDRVAAHPDVAPHVNKRWSDLSEREGKILAREVGSVARDVIRGAGSTERCATCRYWVEPDLRNGTIVLPGAKICSVRSQLFSLVALRPMVGPVLVTEPDFGCVEHRPRLAPLA